MPTDLPDTRAARTAILAALRRGTPPPALPPPDLAPYHRGPWGQGIGAAPAADADAGANANAGAGAGAGATQAGPDTDALTAAFVQAARGWRADVQHATSATWPHVMRAALDARGLRRIAIGAASPLQPQLDGALSGLTVRRFAQPLSTWKHELFGAVDAGITHAAAGIADTGSLLLLPGAAEPRTLSLVPDVHVAVLDAARLQPSLAAAMRALDLARSLPTNLLLVSGPSKTADIQQTLAYGAHGPRELVIVLVQPGATPSEATP